MALQEWLRGVLHKRSLQFEMCTTARFFDDCVSAHPTSWTRRGWGFLNRCEKAAWHASMHPKFHWLVHLPWGLLISALICESKHKVPKRYAREQCSLTGLDKGCPE
jgi:hypothetical protein